MAEASDLTHVSVVETASNAVEDNQSKEAKVEEEELECAVCLQKCVHPVRLPCSHIFCFLCVKGVANQSKRCAMCRQEIPADFLDHPALLSTLDVDKDEIFPGGYQWFYEGRNGWWQYDERTSTELEVSYSSGQRACEVLVAGFLYIIDFDRMVQLRRNDPSRRRRIKRDLSSIPKKGVAGIKLPSQLEAELITLNSDVSDQPPRDDELEDNVISSTTIDLCPPTPTAPSNTPQTPHTPSTTSSSSGSPDPTEPHLQTYPIDRNMTNPTHLTRSHRQLHAPQHTNLNVDHHPQHHHRYFNHHNTLSHALFNRVHHRNDNSQPIDISSSQVSSSSVGLINISPPGDVIETAVRQIGQLSLDDPEENEFDCLEVHEEETERYILPTSSSDDEQA